MNEENKRENIRFSRLMKYREEADYNPSYMFTREDYIELKKEPDSVQLDT